MTPLRINLEREEIPTHWYNVVADMTNPPAPPLGPDGNPGAAGSDGTIFPDPVLEQEMSGRALDPDPGRSARSTPSGAGPALPRLAPGAGPGYAGQDFLQSMKASRRPVWRKPNSAVPQAYFEQARRHPEIDHRDQRRPVGLVKSPTPARCSACRCASSW